MFQRGFTLIETIIASAVLIVFFAAITFIMQILLTIIGESRVRTVATALGQERMEYIRNLPYDSVGTIGGIPSGTLSQTEVVTINNQQFTIITTVVYIDDPYDGTGASDPINADYKQVRVAISWSGAYPSRTPLVFLTTVAPRGIESTLGGGTLAILVFNATGDPVSNASVHIENIVVTPTIDLTVTTDSQGKIQLPGAPACVTCYKATVTKTGYSTERTYSINEVPNPAKPYTTVVAGVVTQLSFAIDVLSSLTVSATGPRENGYPPFGSVQFILKGNKVVGTDTNGVPLYKYQQTFVTQSNGSVTINNLEWDTYDILLPSGSSVDFAGSIPIAPFALLPNSTQSVIFAISNATENSLLTIVTDQNNNPLGLANIHLFNDVYEATKSTGIAGKPDFGQVLFPGLVAETMYNLTINLPSYQEAAASVEVNGDTKEKVILTPQ